MTRQPDLAVIDIEAERAEFESVYRNIADIARKENGAYVVVWLDYALDGWMSAKRKAQGEG